MTREEVIRLAKEAGCTILNIPGVGQIARCNDLRITNLLERFAELVAAEYKQDAERYRWLREQNATLEDRTFYVGVDDRSEPEGIMWVGSDLDAAIDRARGDSK